MNLTVRSRPDGLLSGQSAPVLFFIISSDSSDDNSTESPLQRPTRLTLDDDEQAGDQAPLEGLTVRHRLQLLMNVPVSQELNFESSHAEHGRDATCSCEDESDEGIEQAMDYFL